VRAKASASARPSLRRNWGDEWDVSYALYGSLAVVYLLIPNLLSAWSRLDVPFPTFSRTLGHIERRDSRYATYIRVFMSLLRPPSPERAPSRRFHPEEHLFRVGPEATPPSLQLRLRLRGPPRDRERPGRLSRLLHDRRPDGVRPLRPERRGDLPQRGARIPRTRPRGESGSDRRPLPRP
jgi:hypothetical protein